MTRSSPPLKGKKELDAKPVNFTSIEKAISTAKTTIQLLTPGIPLTRKSPEGGTHIDVPVMYMDFAIDRIHFDPQTKTPLPKGKHAKIEFNADVQEIRRVVEKILKEIEVVEAVEFREPEKAWIIPAVWNKLIIIHIRVSQDGEKIIPDYKLTEEVRRYVN